MPLIFLPIIVNFHVPPKAECFTREGLWQHQEAPSDCRFYYLDYNYPDIFTVRTVHPENGFLSALCCAIAML
jgi:hypothetical protein